MPIVQVPFEVPLEIYDGILSGKYNMFGGVVREALGANKGQIVKHLKPVDKDVADKAKNVGVRVRESIENYFKLDLGRPEILNRIGENIVVFDYIRPSVSELILNSQIERIINSLATEKNLTIVLSEAAKDTLKEKALDNLSNGGRGIGNIVEFYLINPLSRYLFDNDILENAAITIEKIVLDSHTPELQCLKG